MTRFYKMHGLGNDFVVFDAREAPLRLSEQQVRAISDRRTGIGCDQLIIIEPSTRADAFMRIYNADGSEVEACGNASRCVARLLGAHSTIETRAGLLTAESDAAGAVLDMGQPRFEWTEIPLAYAMDTAALPVAWESLEGPAAINVGNPHLVFFVDDVDNIDLGRLGPLIETDPLFPERINVNIAQMIDRGHIRVRTWERGAGLTRACGTGACATAVAAIRRDLADEDIILTLPGGDLHVQWTPGGTIRMTGPATHVFTGDIDIEALG